MADRGLLPRDLIQHDARKAMHVRLKVLEVADREEWKQLCQVSPMATQKCTDSERTMLRRALASSRCTIMSMCRPPSTFLPVPLVVSLACYSETKAHPGSGRTT